MKWIVGLGVCGVLVGGAAVAAPLPPPAAPVIPQAFGYVAVPGVAIKPERSHVYRVIFSATEGAPKPDALVPAVRMAGTELNVLVANGLKLSNADYVIDFHGAGAIQGLLDNAHYRQKYGVDNPNLPVLAELKKAGVRLYACSQEMLATGTGFDTITPDVTVASDGLIVLATFENRGYAFLPF